MWCQPSAVCARTVLGVGVAFGGLLPRLCDRFDRFGVMVAPERV
jgi:hypothetical protein